MSPDTCTHPETETLSQCCGAGDYYGFCGQCRDGAGWDEVCTDCQETVYENVEAPVP